MCRECSIIHTDLKPENVMLTAPINPREWKLPAVDMTRREMLKTRVAEAAAANRPLTRNQKKKLKKKLKKAVSTTAEGSLGASDSAALLCDGTDDMPEVRCRAF